MALTRATDKIIANPDGNLNLSGIVTASSFIGSGSGLTGVASTDHIKTSTTANFTDGIQVGGATTLTGALTGTTGTFSGAISAASGTITGNLGIGGVLTYEDVTNIDSVGVITARSTVSIADSIVHTGDTNTSLRFPAADTITAETAGVERLRINSTGITVTGTAQATDFNSTSDIRLKTNIQTIEDPLAKIIQIEGVSFNWKENNKPALGVIADQVQEILPELVTDGDPKTVNYNGLIGLLIEAVKEQQVQITELKSKLDSLS